MDLNNWVVVFDLDDTLYSENDYLLSGLNAVEEFITKVYKVPFKGKIINAKKAKVKDLWGWCCDTLNLPIDVKESLLWVYRLHTPDIHLYPGINTLLKELSNYNAKLAILSDGRSISQRLKINVLKLNSYPLYLSEEFVSEKPNELRFIEIQNKWEGYKYVYIADNPEKDFKAPQNLGWLCIRADWIKNKIHKKTFEKNIMPEYWVKDPFHVLKILESNL